MSFNLYPQASTTVPEAFPANGYGDLLDQNYVTAPLVLDLGATDLPTGERQFELAGVPMVWWSSRLAEDYALVGTIEAAMLAHQTAADANLKLRLRLSKITRGGSAVESPIATLDSSALAVGTDTTQTFSVALPGAVTILADERILLRAYAVPITDGFGAGTPAARMTYNTPSVKITMDLFVEGGQPSFRPNVTPLYLRNTSVAGIGTFLDLLEAPGSSVVTGNAYSTAGGTEIPWTGSTLTMAEIYDAKIASTANATTYASPTFTPVANRLYLLVVVHSDAAPETTIPTVSSTTGLNFVQVGSSLPFDTIASNVHRLTVFRAMKASGLGSGTYTVTLADAGTGCTALLAEATGLDTSGTDGANAIRNISTGSANASANPSITMGAFAQTYNATFMCAGLDVVTQPTPDPGYLPLSHVEYQYATPNTGLFAAWTPSADTTPSCTLAAADWAGIAVELVAATAPISLEWVSERFVQGWVATAASQFSGALWVQESADAANCGARIKVFQRLPDGTETLVYTWTTPTELSLTSNPPWDLTGGTLNNAVTFHEDDRLIVRLYLTNIGTMAGGYLCTVFYNETGQASEGNSYLSIFATFRLKPETQQASRITDAQTMTGIGN